MMVNLRPYEWMVKYTPQREWIEGCGIFLWLAFILGGIGGGLYLTSLYFNNYTGLILGWIIAVILKGGIHLAELGKPLRAWRVLCNPRNSWITRGLILVIGFGIFGALQIAPAVFPSLPWTSDALVLKVLAALFAFLMILYPGFVMGYIKAIPLWNNALLPVLYLVYGLLDGCGLCLLLVLAAGVDQTALLKIVGSFTVLLISMIVIVSIYFTTTGYANNAGKESLQIILKGHLGPLFYIGVLVLGIVFPLGIFAFTYLTGSVSVVLLTMGVICQLVGSLSIRFCLLKAGLYMPLIPGRR